MAFELQKGTCVLWNHKFKSVAVMEGDFLRSLVERHQLNTSVYRWYKLLNEVSDVFKMKGRVNNGSLRLG